MPAQRKLLNRAALGLALIAFFYICTFKILDRDYWWHIKAGEIMSQTHRLITIEPFAYTRAGAPYISTHEWLAQVAMYKIYDIAGVNGQIFWRSLLVAAAFTVILLIDRQTIWPNVFVVLWAAYSNRPSFMDRPQLFTYVFFACFLWAACYYLRRAEKEKRESSYWQNWRRYFIASLIGLQVLWVNTHGAAAVFGIAIIAALIGQRILEWSVSTSLDSRAAASKELRYLGIVLLALAAAGFVSPNLWHTFEDLFVYTHDQTLALVREWQPRGAGSYALELGPFWLIAAASLWLGTRHRFFSILLLAVTGFLSFQAYRHGIMFILSALGLSMYQLSLSPRYQAALNYLTAGKPWATIASVLVLLGLAWQGHAHDISELQREGYSGYGAAPIAQDAYNFLDKANVQGRMFNTYAIGDYLLFRGYPNRQVYVDGRNIDHGYDFLYRTGAAGFNPDVWKQLEDKYHFTYAVIEYTLAPGAKPEDGLPYVAHLNRNPAWKLVYVDDWIAVYVKDVPENAEIIKTYAYKHIKPDAIEFGRAFEDLAKDDAKAIEEELERAAGNSTRSIKARLLLAHHYADKRDWDKAKEFAETAETAQPYRPEVYEALGLVAAGQERWGAAADFFEKSISLTGGVGLPINYDYLAGIFAKIGDTKKATYYHQKAMSYSSSPAQ